MDFGSLLPQENNKNKNKKYVYLNIGKFEQRLITKVAKFFNKGNNRANRINSIYRINSINSISIKQFLAILYRPLYNPHPLKLAFRNRCRGPNRHLHNRFLPQISLRVLYWFALKTDLTLSHP